MEVLIRPWRKDDFPAVRTILWESWIAAYGVFIPEEDLRAYFEATYQIDSLARLYDNPRVHGFIGGADGKAVGFARTQFHLTENRLYLASLYLLPAFQGKGIGGELLRVAEENARAYGLRELWVGVMVQNEAAGRWYDRRGFRFVREEPFRMGRTTVAHLIGCKAVTEPAVDAMLRRRLSAVYPGKGDWPALFETAAEFLERQKQEWPGLAEGYAALEALRVREVHGGRWNVKVQFNPRRSVSGGARVDPESIGRRPCFLCREHLPPEQRAILYRETYLVLGNPAPIFPGHLTVAHVCHLSQSLPDHLGMFLRLAEDFGPRMVVFYNGPRCGASAPDHLHFQAAPAGLLPVEKELREPGFRAEVKKRGAAVIWRAVGIGRGVVVIEGGCAADMTAAFDAVMGALRAASTEGEPMMNVFCTHSGECWRLMIFPRLKHRPAAYYRKGGGRLSVSPGAVEMGGVFVTHREEDFRTLDLELIADIFREVAFDDAAVETLFAAL